MDIEKPDINGELKTVSDLISFSEDYIYDEIPMQNILCDGLSLSNKDLSRIEIRKSKIMNCEFIDCDLRKAAFIDVIFVDCNLSNSNMEATYFERCEFISCKGIGINAAEAVIKNTKFLYSNFQYASFDKSKLNFVKAIETNFSESSFMECIVKNFETIKSIFIRVNFFKTMLKGIDFSESEFIAPIISDGFLELKGTKINAFQASSLVTIMGIEVI